MGAQLRSVEAGARDVPYPATTNVGSSRFGLAIPRIFASDTWAVTPPELRPWLLMVWATAWVQIPAGSFPDDDAMIAARIGMPTNAFQINRAVLMRGWWKANDGRLYHPVITEQVDAVRAIRTRWRNNHVTTVPPVEHPSAPQGAPRVGVGFGFGGEASVGEVGVSVPAELALVALAPPASKGSRLAEDAELPEEWKVWAMVAYGLDAQKVVRIWLEFRDFWCAVPGVRGRKANWRATWRNRLRKVMGDA